MIDAYIIHLDARILYWINMISAVLDNATLAAAGSVAMSGLRIEAILMGLLVAGGMLIPGNIPNIISAGKLKITRSMGEAGCTLRTVPDGALLCNPFYHSLKRGKGLLLLLYCKHVDLMVVPPSSGATFLGA